MTWITGTTDPTIEPDPSKKIVQVWYQKQEFDDNFNKVNLPLLEAYEHEPELKELLRNNESIRLHMEITGKDGSTLVVDTLEDWVLYALGTDSNYRKVFRPVVMKGKLGSFLFWGRPGSLRFTPDGKELHIELRHYYRIPGGNPDRIVTEVRVDLIPFFKELLAWIEILVFIYEQTISPFSQNRIFTVKENLSIHKQLLEELDQDQTGSSD